MARRPGHDLSVKGLLNTLSGIQETVLIYPLHRGRPETRRITTDMTANHGPLRTVRLHRCPQRDLGHTLEAPITHDLCKRPLKINLPKRLPLGWAGGGSHGSGERKARRARGDAVIGH
jgi:hypothetical protein